MTNPIRLMIVDDQKLMREGLRTLLELEGGFEIVAEAGDGQDASLFAERRFSGWDGKHSRERVTLGQRRDFVVDCSVA